MWLSCPHTEQSELTRQLWSNCLPPPLPSLKIEPLSFHTSVQTTSKLQLPVPNKWDFMAKWSCSILWILRSRFDHCVIFLGNIALLSILSAESTEGGGEGRDGNTLCEFMLLELGYPLTGDVSRFLNLLNYHPSFPTNFYSIDQDTTLLKSYIFCTSSFFPLTWKTLPLYLVYGREGNSIFTFWK